MTDNDYVAELRSYGGRVTNEAADRIEALIAQLAEDADVRTQIDHRIEELVGQVDALTAERDEAIRGNHRSNEHEPTWAELTGVWKARAEAAEKKLQEMQGHIDHADAYHKAMLTAEADNARLREGIQSLEGPLWRLILRDENCIDAPCDDQNCQCRSKFDRIYKQARAALTGNVTVGGGRVDWGDQPVAAPTGKADT
jgi:hypothetical protein